MFLVVYMLLTLLKGEQRNFLKKYKEANDNYIVCQACIRY